MGSGEAHAARGKIVRTKLVSVFVPCLAILLAGASPVWAQAAPVDPNYCPPGAKFCPAPGADNNVFLDTYFGVDAQTGQVTRYDSQTHPTDAMGNVPAQERVLYVAPPVMSVENRFVPYPGAAPTTPPAYVQNITTVQPSPVPFSPQQGYASPPRSRAGQQQQIIPTTPESEVANKVTARSDVSPPRGDRVPWWKGGMWRNRGRAPAPNDVDDAPAPSRSSSSASRSSGGPSALTADDVWDDDYSSSNIGGRAVGQQQQQPAGPYADPFAQPQGGYYNDPYAQPQAYPDPYAQPQYAQDPYGQQPYGQPQYAQPVSSGFVSDAYVMPNAPPPSSPYTPGYTYPGTDLTYNPDPYAGGYSTAPVAAPVAAPMASSTYVAQPAYVPPPPSAAPVATGGPVGSPQFESAVKMVKENRFTEAKSILSRETTENPSNSAAWRWLGDCHYNLLELDDAIRCYQRARELDPNDYYAIRGQGFAYLHKGHELWRSMNDEVSRGQREQAAATFAQAHENYKNSLDMLGSCLRRAPNDNEAIYGEAMAAEGASRKLYSNAVSYLKLGPGNRERAELFAENCLTVINKGIERARDRSRQNPGESGPRALLGGLYLRKAMLYHQLGKKDLALIELKNSHDTQQSILDDIDKNNASAQKGVNECKNYWEEWGGTAI